MIRFLRDADILPKVSHITSVSGGSILAAHLVLNWKRYTGTTQEFDAAAEELLRFVQLDVRNRVVRRYPLAMPIRALRWLSLQRPNRQLTRTGLLEYHYEKYLYGDTCLFQLPERPQLYMLSTNLSEGCLCAFTRNGLLMQRRRPGQRLRFELIHTGLATVPMAVTASSAFPGFFPPIELHAEDVGASAGQFDRLAFTDGGIYDNLGVRMFRCLERSWLAREVRLERDDLVDPAEMDRTLLAAAEALDDTPLRRLSQLLAQPRHTAEDNVRRAGDLADQLLGDLWDVLNHGNLAREPAFAQLTSADADVEALLKIAREDERQIDAGEQLWLNRHLVQTAFHQATGKPCFRSANACFDAVLVSDAGKEFKIVANARAGGLIATSLRASDILMDRVWQLEVDTFTGTPGFVFAPISKSIDPDEDPTAEHPELQRRAAEIRTDLDRFSPLEISALVRHGYCVGRSACRSRPDLFDVAIPTDPPWDPFASTIKPESESRAVLSGAKQIPRAAPVTQQSRKLQRSAMRRIWSTLLDYRDWMSYVYVPLLVPILFMLPYYSVKWYRQSQVLQRLTASIAQSNRDYAVMRTLLTEGPTPPFEGMPIEDVRELASPDYSGFEVIADMRVFDFRSWKATTGTKPQENSWAYGYERLRVMKLDPSANRYSLVLRSKSPHWNIRSRSEMFPAVLRLQRDADSPDGRYRHVFQLDFDLSKVPVREVVDLSVEFQTHDPRPENMQSLNLYVDTETGLLSYWMLMPDDQPYESFSLVRYAVGAESAPESIAPAHQLSLTDGKILGFSLLSPKPGFKYECRWTYPK